VPPAAAPAAEDTGQGLGSDIRRYFTAPLRWDHNDWAWFGGALVAIGASHHYDTQVRTHFIKLQGLQTNAKDGPDTLPTAAVLAATWGYATLVNDENGRREAWAMLEAAGLGSATAYALKYIARREGPDQSSNPNQWGKGGGNSFPSWHSTAAFAVGTVLAESGNDEYRWVRRLLGYGLGAATSYERLKHNAHWLSDTVAGAALGIASARFTMHRTYRDKTEGAALGVMPVERGVMLTWSVPLP
jgi:membrane-associated phospholipid phosphatase